MERILESFVNRMFTLAENLVIENRITGADLRNEAKAHKLLLNLMTLALFDTLERSAARDADILVLPNNQVVEPTEFGPDDIHIYSAISRMRDRIRNAEFTGTEKAELKRAITGFLDDVHGNVIQLGRGSTGVRNGSRETVAQIAVALRNVSVDMAELEAFVVRSPDLLSLLRAVIPSEQTPPGRRSIVPTWEEQQRNRRRSEVSDSIVATQPLNNGYADETTSTSYHDGGDGDLNNGHEQGRGRARTEPQVPSGRQLEAQILRLGEQLASEQAMNAELQSSNGDISHERSQSESVAEGQGHLRRKRSLLGKMKDKLMRKGSDPGRLSSPVAEQPQDNGSPLIYHNPPTQMPVPTATTEATATTATTTTQFTTSDTTEMESTSGTVTPQPFLYDSGPSQSVYGEPAAPVPVVVGEGEKKKKDKKKKDKKDKKKKDKKDRRHREQVDMQVQADPAPGPVAVSAAVQANPPQPRVAAPVQEAPRDPRWDAAPPRQDIPVTRRTARHMRLEEVPEIRDDVKLERKVGGGGFGTVWQGSWRHMPVAIKVLNPPPNQHEKEQLVQSFIQETRILAQLSHPNILTFMGAKRVGENEQLMIVTEYMGNGSLWDRIHGQFSITMEEVDRWAEGMARALDYIHMHSPQILHRDLKSPNVLLDDNGGVKVCDFGLSRTRLNTKATQTLHVGTPQWTAPEVHQSPLYDEKCDVYSFGVVLWEIFAREVPFKGLEPFQIMHKVDRGERPPMPKTMIPKYHKLITVCWAHDPRARPSFLEILDYLNGNSAVLDRYLAPPREAHRPQPRPQNVYGAGAGAGASPAPAPTRPAYAGAGNGGASPYHDPARDAYHHHHHGRGERDDPWARGRLVQVEMGGGAAGGAGGAAYDQRRMAPVSPQGAPPHQNGYGYQQAAPAYVYDPSHQQGNQMYRPQRREREYGRY